MVMVLVGVGDNGGRLRPVYCISSGMSGQWCPVCRRLIKLDRCGQLWCWPLITIVIMMMVAVIIANIDFLYQFE